MNIRSLAVLICSLFILNSCGSVDPTEALVKNYLAESFNIDIKSIDIIELEDAAPWMATDSIKVLTEDLANKKEEIVEHLNAAIEASEKAIEQAEEVTTSGFQALADVAELTIQESKETILMAETQLEDIKNNPEGTILGALNERIEKFKSMGEIPLFQVLKGKWSGADGEEHDFNLMATQDLSEIIGKFGE